MTLIYNALLVLIGRYKAYDPKKYFISRYSDKPRKKRQQAYEEGERET